MRPLAGNASCARSRSAAAPPRSRSPRPGRAGRAQHLDHAADLVLDLRGRAVALAEQDRRRVEVVAGVDEVLDRCVIGSSIISRPAGMMPAAIIAATASPALRTSSKLATMQRAASAFGQQPHRDLDDDGEHALAADDRGEQVEAGGVERVGAELDRRRRRR